MKWSSLWRKIYYDDCIATFVAGFLCTYKNLSSLKKKIEKKEATLSRF